MDGRDRARPRILPKSARVESDRHRAGFVFRLSRKGARYAGRKSPFCYRLQGSLEVPCANIGQAAIFAAMPSAASTVSPVRVSTASSLREAASFEE